MSRKRFTFENRQGHELSGSLEMPDDGEADAIAVFAHCFTCGKDIRSANTIAQALTRAGIGVLRFDFTGLGDSEGDFANTNFSSNVQDLEDAIDRLSEQVATPRLLIGHSLGGAAALVAAANRDCIEAVVTIAAPFPGGRTGQCRRFGQRPEPLRLSADGTGQLHLDDTAPVCQLQETAGAGY